MNFSEFKIDLFQLKSIFNKCASDMPKLGASDHAINGNRQSSLKTGEGGTWRNPIC